MLHSRHCASGTGCRCASTSARRPSKVQIDQGKKVMCADDARSSVHRETSPSASLRLSASHAAKSRGPVAGVKGAAA